MTPATEHASWTHTVTPAAQACSTAIQQLAAGVNFVILRFQIVLMPPGRFFARAVTGPVFAGIRFFSWPNWIVVRIQVKRHVVFPFRRFFF